MKLALNLGCGPNYIESTEEIEWLNTDICDDHNFRKDESWDFRERIPLEDNSVDFILAWHILEHAGLHERGKMLGDWYRVLVPGGRLAVAVPDIYDLFERYKRGEFDWYILMVNIYGPYNGFEGDYHRWGYSREELDKVLNETGFSRVETLHKGNLPVEIKDHTESVDGEKPPLIGLADWAAQFICTK